MGLTAAALWGLCDREYKALTKHWERAHEHGFMLIAALRSDLYNTAGKSFDRTFEPRDFMPGAVDSVEQRAQELIAAGYTPSEAAAMASSKQSRERKLHIIDSALGSVERKNAKGGTKRMRA